MPPPLLQMALLHVVLLRMGLLQMVRRPPRDGRGGRIGRMSVVPLRPSLLWGASPPGARNVRAPAYLFEEVEE
jgi:hypothetical protein